MTPEQINETIAVKLMGWTNVRWIETPSGRILIGFPPGVDTERVVPNFYGDLNAVAEAEKRMLLMVSDRDRSEWFIRMQSTGDSVGIRATAPQRCEAILKTIGEWREGK